MRKVIVPYRENYFSNQSLEIKILKKYNNNTIGVNNENKRT